VTERLDCGRYSYIGELYFIFNQNAFDCVDEIVTLSIRKRPHERAEPDCAGVSAIGMRKSIM